MDKIRFKIDGKDVEGSEGETILQVARRSGIKIPAVCYHSDLEQETSCRLCLVSVAGRRGFFTSCSTPVEEGIEVTTNSPEIKKERQTNLELLFAQHIEKCGDCARSNNCNLLELAKEYEIKITEFKDRKAGYPVYQFGPSIIFDTSKCVDCHNCVQMCKKQGVGFLNIEKHGSFFDVAPSDDPEKDYIYCGQCLSLSPSGGFDQVDAIKDVEKNLEDKDKFVVFEFAPSIRSSIGEEFGMAQGSIVLGQMIAGMKKLGGYKVFDVSVGADVTTIEESEELIERIKENKGLPMFTACCPSWVKYVEFYYPEFIPQLTTVKSPHIILGGIIKTYFAKKENIDPKKIVVVSIMPCTSKKFEITRGELDIDGLKPVDYILTTHELATMFKSKGIDLKTIKQEEADAPWDLPTGAGVIYGATGGVTESALRTAYFKLTGENLKDLEFRQIRGMDEAKTAAVKIGDVTIKIAVLNGLGNAKKMLEKLKEEPRLYDYIEVMSCPGGCIGGGGQPLPTDKETRKARAMALYEIDSKKDLRLAHESPIIKSLYEDFFSSKEMTEKICHTKYSSKKKDIRKIK